MSPISGRSSARDRLRRSSLRAWTGAARGSTGYSFWFRAVGSDDDYLFAGAYYSGGVRAAVIHSLIGTAKLNHIVPEAYLRFVLACIADHATNRADQLMPRVVAKQPRNTR